jgi:peptide/nickel transport system permease protein
MQDRVEQGRINRVRVPTLGRRWRAARENRAVFVGLVIVGLFILVALVAAWIAPYDPLLPLENSRLTSPSLQHLFGTDDFSRDVFTRVIYGTRTSMSVGFTVAVLSTVIGGALGLVTGYYDAVDRILMRIVDGFIAFPAILLAIAIAAALRPNVITVVAALTVVYTPYMVRVMRAPVLSNRNELYVEAARSIGASDARILLLHLLPNSAASLLVQATFTFSFGVLAEAALSFLGVGVPPTTPSWGGMLNQSKDYLLQAPWMTLAPGLALATVTLGLNLLGDGLRDLLDPRRFAQ